MTSSVTRGFVRLVFLLPLLVLTAAPGSASGLRVAGELVDSEGQAIVGGEITATPYRSTYERRGDLLEDRVEPVVARSRSTAAGRFEIEVPDAGMWIVRLSAKGYAEKVVLLLPLLRDQQLLPIELPSAETLTIRVSDAQGEAVAGALVTVSQERGRAHGRARSRSRSARRSLAARIAWQTARTNEHGVVTVQVAGTGKRIVRVVSPDGQVARLDHEAGAKVTVTLPAGKPRTVRVEEANGMPRPNTLLAVGSSMVPIARTDQTGQAVVQWPDAGSIELIAITADDHWGRETLKPLAGDVAPDTFVLSVQAPTAITGVVTSTVGGDPIPGALVWENADASNHVRADGKGRYQLALFDRRHQFVQAGALGFFAGGSAVTSAAFASGDGPSLVLEPGFDQRGVVVDTDGRPVDGARVSVAPIDRWGQQTAMGRGQSTAQTGSDGRFVVGPLPAEVALRLSTRRAGFAPASVELPVVPPGAAAPEVRIELIAGQIGFGYVLDADELPVAGVDVYLMPGLKGGMTLQAVYRAERMQPAHEVSAADGRFVFADLGPDSYDLSVEGAGFAPVVIPGIVVAAGETETDLGTILMEPGAILEGVVVDADERPLADAKIFVQQAMGMLAMLRAADNAEKGMIKSGIDGRFRVEDLRPGHAATMNVTLEGFTSVMQQGVQVPSPEPMRVVLVPAGRVSGIVVDENGDGVEHATVFFQPDGQGRFGGSSQNVTSDADGHFEVKELGAGRWRLTIGAEGFQETERGGIEIKAGETHASLRVVLAPGAALVGRVYGADGEALVGASVLKVSRAEVNGRFSFSRFGSDGTTSEAGGSYRLDGLATGLTTITAEAADHRKHVRDIEIKPGENRLDFRLDRGWAIGGEVVDGGGDPIAGAQVMVVPSTVAMIGFSGSNETTRADGTFEIGGLEDGSYSLSASREGYAPTTTESPVRVAGGSVSGVVLRLGSGATVKGQILGLGIDDLGQVQVMAFSRTAGGGSLMSQVDFEGRYRIENLGPGEWTIMAMVGSRSSNAMEQQTIGAGDSELTVDLDFGGRIAVQGQVLLASAAPAVGYVVSVRSLSLRAFGQGHADGQGRFRVGGLLPGQYDLTVSSPAGTQVHHETVDLADGDELAITIEALRVVTGRVVDALDGRPIDGAAVSITPSAGDQRPFGRQGVNMLSGSDGRFRFDQLSPGAYRIKTSKDGYSVANTNVDIAGADVGDLEVRLESSVGVTLFVRFANGRTAGTASIVALDAAEQAVLSGQYPVGEEGRVRLTDLPVGSWTLLISADYSATVARAVEVPGAPVTAVIPEGGSLTVRVPSLDGAGRAGTLRALDPQGRPYRAAYLGRTSGNWDVVAGVARVVPITAGSWTLELTMPDGAIIMGAATVAPGATVEVTLQ